jgi:hypothetical protein
MLETVSNLYGTTSNPHNTYLTPGGSTGGEAALIAMRGSILGIGTDIGKIFVHAKLLAYLIMLPRRFNSSPECILGNLRIKAICSKNTAWRSCWGSWRNGEHHRSCWSHGDV